MTAAVACEAPRQSPGDAEGRAPGHRGVRRYPSRSTVRIRLLDAMADLARGVGRERVTTSRLYRHAGVGRRVFESEFAGIEECFEEAVEVALGHLLARVSNAIASAGPEWPDRVSAAVVGFLRFLDEQPARAWMAIVEPLGGGDRARFARRRALERLGALIGDGPPDAVDAERPRRTADDVAGGLWEMARQYLWNGPQAVDPDAVAGSTIFLALSPYLGRRDAMLHATAAPRIARLGGSATGRSPAPATGAGASDGTARPPVVPRIAVPAAGRPAYDPLMMIPVLTALAADTLVYLEHRPGAAGVDVSAAIGVGHPSQTSRHLRRLEELDLVWSERDGRCKRWTLTDRGAAVVERLRDR